MKNKKRVLTLLLSIAICLSFFPINASAKSSWLAENMRMINSNTTLENPDVLRKINPNNLSMNRDASYLNNCSISIAYESYGLYIQTETGTTKDATELGVKDIKVQQKNGIFWNTIATSGGGSIKNDHIFCGSCKCTNAVDGQTYRIKCTHYAYIGGNYYHYDNTTDGFKYVKP